MWLSYKFTGCILVLFTKIWQCLPVENIYLPVTLSRSTGCGIFWPVPTRWGISSTGWENSSSGSHWPKKHQPVDTPFAQPVEKIPQPVDENPQSVEDFFNQLLPVEDFSQPVEEIPHPVATGLICKLIS